MNKLLLTLCAATLAAILTAGLWPFTPSPKNQVSWPKNGSGLDFGNYGSILSKGAFQPTKSPQGAACSLEMWLRPGLIDDTNTMLAFYSPDGIVSFSMHQSIGDLVLQREVRNQQGRLEKFAAFVDDVFRRDKDAFITITSSNGPTLAYLDGSLIKSIPNFGVSNSDFVGQLVLANSPVANDSWSGRLRGLAIFHGELSATEVRQDYESWTKTGRPLSSSRADVRALYLFAEGKGDVIHNVRSDSPDLYIPDHYFVLHQVFLERPWNEFQLTSGYAKDILINVCGFVPLGFFFCAYFLSIRKLSHPVLLTILLGALVSLTIEVLQAFMPTRDSGMTDIITNTLGTALGAMFYPSKVCQALIDGVAILVRSQKRFSRELLKPR